MGKVEFFWGKNFFFEVLIDGLNIIQFSQSKNEGNPKLLVIIWLLWGFPSQHRVKKINGNTLFRRVLLLCCSTCTRKRQFSADSNEDEEFDDTVTGTENEPEVSEVPNGGTAFDSLTPTIKKVLSN